MDAVDEINNGPGEAKEETTEQKNNQCFMNEISTENDTESSLQNMNERHSLIEENKIWNLEKNTTDIDTCSNKELKISSHLSKESNLPNVNRSDSVYEGKHICTDVPVKEQNTPVEIVDQTEKSACGDRKPDDCKQAEDMDNINGSINKIQDVAVTSIENEIRNENKSDTVKDLFEKDNISDNSTENSNLYESASRNENHSISENQNDIDNKNVTFASLDKPEVSDNDLKQTGDREVNHGTDNRLTNTCLHLNDENETLDKPCDTKDVMLDFENINNSGDCIDITVAIASDIEIYKVPSVVQFTNLSSEKSLIEQILELRNQEEDSVNSSCVEEDKSSTNNTASQNRNSENCEQTEISNSNHVNLELSSNTQRPVVCDVNSSENINNKTPESLLQQESIRLESNSSVQQAVDNQVNGIILFHDVGFSTAKLNNQPDEELPEKLFETEESQSDSQNDECADDEVLILSFANSSIDNEEAIITDYVIPTKTGLSDTHPFLSASAKSQCGSFEDEKSVALTTKMASAIVPPEMPLQLAPTILTNSTQPVVSIPNLNTLKHSPSKNYAKKKKVPTATLR